MVKLKENPFILNRYIKQPFLLNCYMLSLFCYGSANLYAQSNNSQDSQSKSDADLGASFISLSADEQSSEFSSKIAQETQQNDNAKNNGSGAGDAFKLAAKLFASGAAKIATGQAKNASSKCGCEGIPDIIRGLFEQAGGKGSSSSGNNFSGDLQESVGNANKLARINFDKIDNQAKEVNDQLKQLSNNNLTRDASGNIVADVDALSDEPGVAKDLKTLEKNSDVDGKELLDEFFTNNDTAGVIASRLGLDEDFTRDVLEKFESDPRSNSGNQEDIDNLVNEVVNQERDKKGLAPLSVAQTSGGVSLLSKNNTSKSAKKTTANKNEQLKDELTFESNGSSLSNSGIFSKFLKKNGKKNKKYNKRSKVIAKKGRYLAMADNKSLNKLPSEAIENPYSATSELYSEPSIFEQVSNQYENRREKLLTVDYYIRNQLK